MTDLPQIERPDLIVPIEIGETFLQARKSDPDIRPGNAGGLAILEWLGSYVERTDHAGRSVLIVHENGKIPRSFGKPASLWIRTC